MDALKSLLKELGSLLVTVEVGNGDERLIAANQVEELVSVIRRFNPEAVKAAGVPEYFLPLLYSEKEFTLAQLEIMFLLFGLQQKGNLFKLCEKVFSPKKRYFLLFGEDAETVTQFSTGKDKISPEVLATIINAFKNRFSVRDLPFLAIVAKEHESCWMIREHAEFGRSLRDGADLGAVFFNATLYAAKAQRKANKKALVS